MTTNKSAQTLVEISIGVGIFAMIAAAVITLAIGSYQANFKAAQETKANHLARQGLEATRAIRNYNWEGLADGSHGLTNVNGYWEFQDSPETIGAYTREIIVEPITRQGDYCGLPGGPNVTDPDAKKITSKITWQTIPKKSRTIELVSYLSDWMSPSQTECIKCEPYEITSALTYNQDTVLDWSGRDVVIREDGKIKANSTSSGPLTLTIITNCSLTIEDEGEILAMGTAQNGNGGTINVQGYGGVNPEVNIDGGVLTDGYLEKPEELSAKGGLINIEASDLIIKGKITARGYTFSPNENSPGGTVNIKATDFNHQHPGEISVSAFSVKSASEKPDAGTINIETQEFVNSGKIKANTYGQHGRAGIINIKVKNISASSQTEITADSWGITGEAVGGQITLLANQLNILTSSVSAIDKQKQKKPGTISLIYCQKDFTGTTFNPEPEETISCP